jgi:LysM repeat protein
MNNQSPLIPQGSLLEQKTNGRARMKIAVFFVLAIHGIGLLALLMQGCQKDKQSGMLAEQTNNVATPAFVEPTNPPVVATTDAPPAQATPATPTPLVTETVHAPAMASTNEYTIAKGDNFTTIGKKFGVSAKAIADANPGVESSKLRPGKQLHIPAATAAPVHVVASTTSGTIETTSGEKLYTVKSGDVLFNIARDNHTTVKAIRSANSLKTDSIKVGQKLKIPAKAPSAPLTASAAQ